MHIQKVLCLLGTLGIITCIFWPLQSSHACSPIWSLGNVFETIDDPNDITPPHQFTFNGMEIRRASGASTSDCSAYGNIKLFFSVFDEHSDRVGLEYRLVSGEPPMNITSDFVMLETDDLLWTWADGNDRHKPFEFVIEVRAVDHAGNRTEPMAITVTDDGSPATDGDSMTCHTNPRHPPAIPTVALLMIGLTLVLRRVRTS